MALVEEVYKSLGLGRLYGSCWGWTSTLLARSSNRLGRSDTCCEGIPLRHADCVWEWVEGRGHTEPHSGRVQGSRKGKIIKMIRMIIMILIFRSWWRVCTLAGWWTTSWPRVEQPQLCMRYQASTRLSRHTWRYSGGGQVVTTLGNKVKPAMPHKHLKEKILSKLDILSEEQLKKLTSKAWRKVILSNVLAYFVTKLFLSNDKFRNILETFIQHCSMFPPLRWGLCKIIELLNCVVFVGKLFDSNDRVKNIIQLCMQHLVYFHTT